MDQSRFNQLKSLQENIDWKAREERHAFLRRVAELIANWEDDLPNLRHIFRPAEIELLLVDAVNCFSNDSQDPEKTFIDFVVRCGYVDEPGEVECREGVRPSLGRVTALHLLFELYWDLLNDDWLCDGLDEICFNLLKIYDRYDIDYVEEATGVTHFHVACRCLLASDDDQLRIVAKFLELGQDPNHVVRKTGYAPLHLALQRNNVEAMLLLLRAGADPNSVTWKQEDTPLHIMGKLGVSSAVAEKFFRACDESNRLVRIDALNHKNCTPLVEALIYDNEEVAALLLRRGADPNFFNNEFGITPLHVICLRDNWDKAARILFKICDELNLPLQVNARDNNGKTPLEVAMVNVRPDTVEMLLDHGADLPEGLFSTVIDPKMFYHSLKICGMKTASGVLAIAELFEGKGYNFSQNDALTIMKFFAEFGLFEKSVVAKKKFFYDDEEFKSKAKEIKVNSNLSLYDLVQLRPEEEEKLLTYQDYFRFASTVQLWRISTEFTEACILHVCEKMSRGFFRRWALYPFYELIHKRLPTECSEVILEKLSNQDLFNICLAAKHARSSLAALGPY
uniref:Uncharacterized protein n=1 Tax=Trichogramma kaykai TaxID=54128 RepID=A0ABD2XIA2_9HYME